VAKTDARMAEMLGEMELLRSKVRKYVFGRGLAWLGLILPTSM
jgi:hypothetical protein